MYLFVFYIVTLFSIKFQEKQLISPEFSFIDNYGVHYIILFYLIGLFMIIYIIYRLYFIMVKKSQTFSLTSTNERTLIIRKLFQSLVARHIIFIFYFLVTFVPINFMMILKYIFRLFELSNFYLSFITMTLLSLYGTFIFSIKLTEPITRHFFLSFFLCDKGYIKEYEPLMRTSNLNISKDEISDSGNEYCEKEKDILMNAYREYDKSFVTFYNQRQMLFDPFLQKNKYTSFTLGNNYGLHFIQGEKKELSKFAPQKLKTYSMKNINSIQNKNTKNHLFYDSSSNFMEMFYYQDESEIKKENNNINIEINFVSNEKNGKGSSNINNSNTNISLNKSKSGSKKKLKLIQSKDSFSDIKEENCPIEESIKEETEKSNSINSNLTKQKNSSNLLFQRNLSIIPIGTKRNISKFFKRII